jgi:fluoride ion exporter CrcB/FEX
LASYDYPMHQRVEPLLLVFVGCSVGTLLRAVILKVALVPSTLRAHEKLSLRMLHAVPVGLLTVNTLGCFLAGYLLVGPLRAPQRARMRALVVPGVLGGLTSYSALIAAGHAMWLLNRPCAVIEVFAAVLVGLGAAWGGALVARS